MRNEEVVEHQIPMRGDKNMEQSLDWRLMEDSIEVFKTYKLLQWIKNKWYIKYYEFVLFAQSNGLNYNTYSQRH